MLLYPKKIKYKKIRKGTLKRFNYKTFKVKFGSIGLKSLESGVISARNIEAARQSISRKIKRKGKLWTRIFPHTPITAKSLGARMGKGKGSFQNWSVKVKGGNMLFELCGVPANLAIKAFQTGGAKLPVKTAVTFYI